jgi:copper homeostasis protein (lipoprotein)
MRTQIAIVTLIVAAFSLSGCFSKAATPMANQTTTQHTSKNSLDWYGSYAGVIPCADCAGIETWITLNKDLSYRLRTRYLGKDDRVFERQGTFVWEENGNVIYLKDLSEGPNRYHVGENLLFQLDKQGKRITGDLAEKYILRKVADSNAGALHKPFLPSQWGLTELMGKRVDQEPGIDPLPGMKFEREGGRVYGFSGCNQFTGAFEVMAGARIRFSKMAMTKKACPDMNVEMDFMRVLETADSYHVDDQELILYRARMAPLARFRAVTEKRE